MKPSTADELKLLRTALGLSQSALARRSGVPRWKINTCELGDTVLSSAEANQIRTALQAEADRLQTVAANVHFDQPVAAA